MANSAKIVNVSPKRSFLEDDLYTPVKSAMRFCSIVVARTRKSVSVTYSFDKYAIPARRNTVRVQVLFYLLGEPDSTRCGEFPVRGKSKTRNGNVVGMSFYANSLHEDMPALRVVALCQD
jgi:hypothetical protein